MRHFTLRLLVLGLLNRFSFAGFDLGGLGGGGDGEAGDSNIPNIGILSVDEAVTHAQVAAEGANSVAEAAHNTDGQRLSGLVGVGEASAKAVQTSLDQARALAVNEAATTPSLASFGVVQDAQDAAENANLAAADAAKAATDTTQQGFDAVVSASQDAEDAATDAQANLAHTSDCTTKGSTESTVFHDCLATGVGNPQSCDNCFNQFQANLAGCMDQPPIKTYVETVQEQKITCEQTMQNGECAEKYSTEDSRLTTCLAEPGADCAACIASFKANLAPCANGANADFMSLYESAASSAKKDCAKMVDASAAGSTVGVQAAVDQLQDASSDASDQLEAASNAHQQTFVANLKAAQNAENTSMVEALSGVDLLAANASAAAEEAANLAASRPDCGKEISDAKSTLDACMAQIGAQDCACWSKFQEQTGSCMSSIGTMAFSEQLPSFLTAQCLMHPATSGLAACGQKLANAELELTNCSGNMETGAAGLQGLSSCSCYQEFKRRAKPCKSEAELDQEFETRGWDPKCGEEGGSLMGQLGLRVPDNDVMKMLQDPAATQAIESAVAHLGGGIDPKYVSALLFAVGGGGNEPERRLDNIRMRGLQVAGTISNMMANYTISMPSMAEFGPGATSASLEDIRSRLAEPTDLKNTLSEKLPGVNIESVESRAPVITSLPTSTTSTTTAASSGSSFPWWAWILLALLLLATIGAAAYYCFLSSKAPKKAKRSAKKLKATPVAEPAVLAPAKAATPAQAALPMAPVVPTVTTQLPMYQQQTPQYSQPQVVQYAQPQVMQFAQPQTQQVQIPQLSQVPMQQYSQPVALAPQMQSQLAQEYNAAAQLFDQLDVGHRGVITREQFKRFVG